jgi:predicted metal-dependent hydrolase
VKIEPEEQDFDPDEFDEAARVAAFSKGVTQFDAGEYHAAHESFEACWLSAEGGDADFYKGLIQASICLYHFDRGNLEGARKLYGGHRRYLGAFLPAHAGIDVAALLEQMQRVMRPILRPGTLDVRLEAEDRPQLTSK